MKKLIIIFAFILFAAVPSLAEEIAIIVNKGVDVSSIDAKQLEKIVELAKKKWDNGKKIVIFDMGDSEAQTKFYKFVGTTASKIKKVWLKKKLTEGATPPTKVDGASEMLSKVASTAGAIGYVPASQVDESVKVIGKIP